MAWTNRSITDVVLGTSPEFTVGGCQLPGPLDFTLSQDAGADRNIELPLKYSTAWLYSAWFLTNGYPEATPATTYNTGWIWRDVTRSPGYLTSQRFRDLFAARAGLPHEWADWWYGNGLCVKVYGHESIQSNVQPINLSSVAAETWASEAFYVWSLLKTAVGILDDTFDVTLPGADRSLLSVLRRWVDGPIMLRFMPESWDFLAESSTDSVLYNGGNFTRFDPRYGGLTWSAFLSATASTADGDLPAMGPSTSPVPFNCLRRAMRDRVMGWAYAAGVLAHEITHRLLWWEFGWGSGEGIYSGMDFRSYRLAEDASGNVIRLSGPPTGGTGPAMAALPSSPLAEYAITPGHWMCIWIGALVMGAARAPIWAPTIGDAERKLWLDTAIAEQLDREHGLACGATDPAVFFPDNYWPRALGGC